MTENWLMLAIYSSFWVLILVLMGAVAFKKYKKHKIASRRRNFRLLEGEQIEKVRTGHKCNND